MSSDIVHPPALVRPDEDDPMQGVEHEDDDDEGEPTAKDASDDSSEEPEEDEEEERRIREGFIVDEDEDEDDENDEAETRRRKRRKRRHRRGKFIHRLEYCTVQLRMNIFQKRRMTALKKTTSSYWKRTQEQRLLVIGLLVFVEPATRNHLLLPPNGRTLLNPPMKIWTTMIWTYPEFKIFTTFGMMSEQLAEETTRKMRTWMTWTISLTMRMKTMQEKS